MDRKINHKQTEGNNYEYIADWQISQMKEPSKLKEYQKGYDDSKETKVQTFINQK